MPTTPPDLISYVSLGSTGTTSPKTASVTVQNGDILVAVGWSETNNVTPAAPTGGTGITWTLRESQTNTNYGPVFIWTAPVTSSQTFTASMSRATGSTEFGGGIFIIRNHGGLGAHSSTFGSTGTPSVTFSTNGDDSLTITVVTDWNTTSGTAAYLSVNGAPTSDVNATGNSRYYAFHYSDTGAQGSKSFGMSAPSGQKWQIAAIEILGVTSGSGGVQKSAGFFGAAS